MAVKLDLLIEHRDDLLHLAEAPVDFGRIEKTLYIDDKSKLRATPMQLNLGEGRATAVLHGKRGRTRADIPPATPYLLPLRPTERLETMENSGIEPLFSFSGFHRNLSTSTVFKYTADTIFCDFLRINFRIDSPTVGLYFSSLLLITDMKFEVKKKLMRSKKCAISWPAGSL
ncbi:hypothetical protein AWM79_11685 [Pseudomonas agarici]|uniref:Uncharacterized protein n=1 Tax=Pseudomonas agarici TaxID=46677 RepID=A0A0X1T1H9_PSEAA|nr:hypothetical protein AWM79_11685 [Pseudomonas agarici]